MSQLWRAKFGEETRAVEQATVMKYIAKYIAKFDHPGPGDLWWWLGGGMARRGIADGGDRAGKS